MKGTPASFAAPAKKREAATTIWRAHAPRCLGDRRIPPEEVTLMIKLLCVGLKTESGAALRQLSGCHGRRESNEVVMRERRAGHGLCFLGRHDVRSARTL